MADQSGAELSVEERNLLLVSYKNSVGSRRAVKMKADYFRYIAEFTDGNAKSKAAASTHAAYAEAEAVAEKDLAVSHPIRLGLVLIYSVFMYEVLSNPGQVCKMARTAFEDATAELDNVAEDSYKVSTHAALARQLGLVGR